MSYTEEITDRGRIRELFEEYARTRGGGLGGGGSAPREYGIGNPQGFGGAVMVAIQQGRLAVDADGNLIPGPNYDPNNPEDAYLLGRYQAGMLTDDPESPEQEGVSVEEFEAIFGEDVINEDIVESGMYTDPETGTVYVINFPPDYEIPEEQEDTDGGGTSAEASTETEGDPTEQAETEAEQAVTDIAQEDTVDDADSELASTIPAEGDLESEAEPGFGDDREYYDPNTEYEVGDVVYDVFGREWVYVPSPFNPDRDRWLILDPDEELIREYEEATGREYNEDELRGVAVFGDPTGSLEDDPNYVWDEEDERGEGQEQETGEEQESDYFEIPDFSDVDVETRTEETTEEATQETTQPTEEATQEATEETTQPIEEATEEATQEAEQPVEEVTESAEEAETVTEEAGAEQPSEESATGADEVGTEGAGEEAGAGEGEGTGDGSGDGTGLGGGMLSKKPLETDGVSQYGIAYQTPQLRQVAVPKKDYVAELDALIERSLFGRMI